MNTNPLKYIDTTPYDLDVYDQEGKKVGTSPEGLDRYYGGHYGYGIDLSMKEIMKPDPKAIEYYNKSLNLHESVGEKKWIAAMNNKLGKAYIQKGDYTNSI